MAKCQRVSLHPKSERIVFLPVLTHRRFDVTRWMEGRELSPAAKTTFCAFGAGATSCLGINLAWMELRYATSLFFRECKGIQLALGTTPESMELENYFVIVPKAHKCEVTLKADQAQVLTN